MATYTTKYRLKKPALEDFGDVADINANMDIIDGALTNKADLGEDGKILPEQLPESGSETVEDAIADHNADPSAHSELRESITSHTTNANIHVTSTDKQNWNSKAPGSLSQTVSQLAQEVEGLQDAVSGGSSDIGSANSSQSLCSAVSSDSH